jgi:hypothetical protein
MWKKVTYRQQLIQEGKLNTEQYEDAWNEHELNGDFIDWNHWMRHMKTLTSEQACLLMHGLDPSIFKGQRPSTSQEAVDKVLNLAHKLMALADSTPSKPETPSEWRKWADELGFKVNSQFLIETNTPLENATGSDQPKNGATLPTPLTTSEIAESFYDFRWKTSLEARKALGKKPAWALDAIAVPGIQGKQAMRWSPIWFGFKLITSGYAKAPQIRARFRTLPLLQEWLELWKDFEADNLEEH